MWTHSITQLSYPQTSQAENVSFMRRKYIYLQHVGHCLSILHWRWGEKKSWIFASIQMSLCIKWNQNCKHLWFGSHKGGRDRWMQVFNWCVKKKTGNSPWIYNARKKEDWNFCKRKFTGFAKCSYGNNQSDRTVYRLEWLPCKRSLILIMSAFCQQLQVNPCELAVKCP